MIKICLNCGNKFNAKSNSAKYCDDCKNGKIYMPGRNNEVYGELKVYSVYRHKDKQYAECTCSCGKKCETRYDSLRDGRVVSCGHIGERNLFERENLSGRINKNGIKILYRKEEKRNNEYIYNCICTCGKEFDITSNNFSNAISCGHARDNARRNNIKHAQNEALAVYKLAKAAFMETVSRDNIKGDAKKWVEFCRAKADCMRLGVRI